MKGTCVTCGKPLQAPRSYICADCIDEEMLRDEIRHGSILGLAVERAEKASALLEAAKRLMQIENEKWPEYVRRQFAEMRNAIAHADVKL